MNAPISDETAKRERTLLTALLLSAWGPLSTGIAVAVSSSTTQVADFLRRTVDLIALFVSWSLYRRIRRQKELSPTEKERLENIAGLFVAGTLSVSALIMLGLLYSRSTGFAPGGTVWPGLLIAVAGGIVNSWFWWRYTKFHREQHDSILASQARLYRAKTFVDACVIVALASIVIDPSHPVTRLLDLFGSALVAFYLLWSGIRTGLGAHRGLRRSEHG